MNGQVEWKPLSAKVIVAAREGAVGDWAAYIGAVPGHNHEKEYEEVLANGEKLPQEVAEVLFPNFKRLRWRG